MDKIVKLKCVSALQECKKHVQRITTALTFLEPLFPVTVDRFAKLQDCIGLRLIPTLYALLESDTTAHPFIDILNRLEKLGVLASAEDWQYFRSLRNNFAHEYPERPEDIVLGLNALHASWDRFMALYMQLAEKAEELIGTEDLKCPLSHK